MNQSHHKQAGDGVNHHASPVCQAHHASTDFKVLHRAPQLTGDPEFAVCCGDDAVALFFDEDDARHYALWRNLKYPKKLPTPTY